MTIPSEALAILKQNHNQHKKYSKENKEMNKDYIKAIKIITDFRPEAAEMFQEYKKVELAQWQQFKSFVNMISTGERDEHFKKNLDMFLKTNEYLDSDGSVNFKRLLEELYDGLEEFNKTHMVFFKKFEKSLNDVIYSNGFFRNTMTIEKAEAFLDGIEYLLLNRIKCLCYVAAVALLNNSFRFVIGEMNRIRRLEAQYNLKIDRLPDAYNALKYMEIFAANGFNAST